MRRPPFSSVVSLVGGSQVEDWWHPVSACHPTVANIEVEDLGAVSPDTVLCPADLVPFADQQGLEH